MLACALPGGASAAVLQSYPIPVTGGAEAIVSGPDGALWFTEPTADAIGRLTTAGGFSAHPVTPGQPSARHRRRRGRRPLVHRGAR